MELEQLFTDKEKEELNRFVNNPVMFEAVKKVVLSSVYFDGTIRKEGIPDPLTNFALALASLGMQITNEELGKSLKESLAGVQLLEKGFQKLQRFNKKKVEPREEKLNPAR